MPRLRPVSKAALAVIVALPLSLFLLSCTGGGDDPSSPSQAVAGDTYLRATFTLLDTAAPCRPGVACDPEFYSCSGATGHSIPKTWTMHATRATAGAINFIPYAPDVPPATGTDSFATINVTGTDTASNTSVSLGFTVQVDRNTGAVTSAAGGSVNYSSANIETSCTQLNGGFLPVTYFGRLGSQPSSVTVTPPVSNRDLVFATGPAVALENGLYEGTFSFVAENRQEFGQVYAGRILVEGCFRLQIPLDDQDVAVDETPAAAACP